MTIADSMIGGNAQDLLDIFTGVVAQARLNARPKYEDGLVIVRFDLGFASGPPNRPQYV